MTKEELSKLLKLPLKELAEYCGADENKFGEIATMIFNFGISCGQNLTNDSYNKAFKGYNAVTRKN